MTQQPTISQRKTRILTAALALCGAAAAWAWSQPARADAPLLRAATTDSAAPGSQADEAERMHYRIRQRMRERRGTQEAPYGTGYEARRQLGAETSEDASRIERAEPPSRPERPDRPDRPERPDRPDRPEVERGTRGGR